MHNNVDAELHDKNNQPNVVVSGCALVFMLFLMPKFLQKLSELLLPVSAVALVIV